MASRSDKRVADATTKLGRAIAEALRSWAQEVGADDLASDVVDRVREGFDVVLDRAHEATGKAHTRARSRAKNAAAKASKKVRSAAKKASTEGPQRRQEEDAPQDAGQEEDRSREKVSRFQTDMSLAPGTTLAGRRPPLRCRRGFVHQTIASG